MTTALDRLIDLLIDGATIGIWRGQDTIQISMHLPKPAVTPPAEDTNGRSDSTDNGWFDVTECPLVSGQKTYTLRVGQPVSVKGFGKKTAKNPAGAPKDAVIKGIQKRVRSGVEDFNVAVQFAPGTTIRTVKRDVLIYKRPKGAR